MAQGSVTVSLQTKLEGWREELARIQSEAKKLKIGSELGKNVSSNLKGVEKEVEQFARTINHRLTSDTQIDNFVDKMADIDTKMRDLGQTLTGVTFEDLRPEAVTKELNDLVSAAQKAREELSGKMDSGLQTAIESSKSLKTALSRMGIDPKDMGIDELKSALDKGVENITAKIQAEKQELDNARESAKTYEEQLRQLGEVPITKVDDIKSLARDMVGNASDYGFGEKIIGDMDALKEKLTSGLAGVKRITDEKRAEVASAIEDLVTSDSAEAFRENLEKLKNIAAAGGQGIVKALSFSKNGLTGKLEDYIAGTSSVQAIENGLNKLRALLQEKGLTDKDLDPIWGKIKDAANDANFDALTTMIERAMMNARSSLNDEKDKLTNDITEVHNKIKQLESDIRKDQYTQRTGNAARTELDKIVEDLRQQCADLEKRVKELENKANVEKQKIVNETRSTGQGVSNRSSKELNEDALAARMYKDELAQVQAREQMIGKIQGVVQRWFSIYAAVRMVSNAIKSVISTIKELDKTITEIAIVTNMSQSQLWDQMPKYTQLAKQYASSISGVYRVSQLYYQQGLQMNDVMALTEQTLKMARISGLDYAQATDYMTNAVRSFKMEMTDAQTVVDVYSAVAASSATNVSELASAMSKTASSAQAVGSSFENTTAMMAVMIEATRESAENIGSAMKSIISRYGEMKADPTKLVDSEGEEMSLNKVDKALKTVGISIQNANHEFRNFDDVIMDLAEKWDTIDTNTQRYIATIMAGNRQQSRFLALVSSYDRLKELTAEAAESENAAQLQFLKTLDSVDAKAQQLQTSLQSLYVNTGLEEVYKNALDWLNRVVTTLTDLPQIAGLPIPAIVRIGTTFASVANIVTVLFGLMKNKMALQAKAIRGEIDAETNKSVNNSNEKYEEDVANYEAAAQRKIEIERAAQAQITAIRNGEQISYFNTGLSSRNPKGNLGLNTKGITRGWAITGLVANMAGLLVQGLADNIDEKTQTNRNTKAGLTSASSILQGVGLGASIGGAHGAIIGGILGAAKGAIEAIGIATESTEEKLAHLQETITDASNARIVSKNELKTLEDYKKKYEELSKAQYNSAEAKQEFIDLQNEIAATYPELITRMDEEGNYIVDLTNGYQRLAEAKRTAYAEDIIDSIAAETAGLKDADYVLSNIYGMTPIANSKTWLNMDASSIESLLKINYNNPLNQQEITGHLSNTATANQVFSNLKTPNGQRGEFIDVDSVLANKLYTVYSAFIDKIINKKSYEDAAEEIEKELGETYKALIDAFSPTVYKELTVRQQTPEYQEELLANQTSAYNTELVNLLADQTSDTFNLASTDIQKRFAKESLSKAFMEWEKGLDEKTKTDPEKWKEKVKEFYASYNAIWYKAEREAEYINDLTTEQNEFYQQLGQHTEAEIEAMFPYQSIDGLDGTELEAAKAANKRYEFIKKIFTKDYKNLLESYNDWLASDLAQQFGVNDYSAKVGPELLAQIQTQYQNFLSNSGLSDNQKTGQTDQLNKILNIITSDNVDFKTRNSLLGKLSAADFTTLHGIHAFANEIKGMDGLEADIAQQIQDNALGLVKYINLNFNTEIQQYLTTFTNKVADMEKDISSATKGMDFKTASTMATKLGKTLGSFRTEAGKYFYDNVEDIVTYYQSESDEYLEDLKNQYFTRSHELESFLDSDSEVITQFNYKAFRTATDHIAYLEPFKEALGANYELFVEAWEDYQDEIFENFGPDANTEEAWIKFLKERFIGENATDEDLANSWIGKLQASYQDESLATILARTSEDNLENVLEPYKDKFKEFGVTTEKIIEYVKAYNQGLGKTIDAGTSLTDYIISEGDSNFLNAWTEIVEESKQYAKVTAGRALISAGQLETFFKLYADKVDAAKQQIILNAAMSGDFSTLDKDTYSLMEPYMDLLISTFKDAKTETLNSIIDMINSNGSTKISVTEKNREYLKELQTKGLVSADLNLNNKSLKEVDINTDVLTKNSSLLFDLISSVYTTEKEQLEAYQKAHENLYKNNYLGNIKNLQKDGQITFKDFTNYLTTNRGYSAQNLMADNEKVIKSEAQRYGLIMTATGDYMITDWAAYVEQINTDLQFMLTTGLTINGAKATQTDINAAKAAVDEARAGQQNAIRTAAEDLIKNYQNVTTSMIETLANATGADYDFIAQFVHENGDGTKYLDIGAFKTLVSKGLVGATEETRTTLLNMFSSITDEYVQNLTTATSLVSQGTTSQADMTNFLKKYEQVTGTSVKNAFSYDQILDAWTLNPIVLRKYVVAQTSQLVKEGLLTQAEVNDYIESQVHETLANAVDFAEFYKANNIAPDSYASNKFVKQLENWLGGTGKEVSTETVNKWMQEIIGGGEVAVQAITKIKGEGKVSTEELEAAYNASINRLRSAVEQVTSEVGDTITGSAVAIMQAAGYKMDTLDDGSAVITSMGNMADAYNMLYTQMAFNAQSTQKELNNVYAQYLTASEQGNIDAIEAMGNAMGMTYEAFGDLLAQYGKNGFESLQYALNNSIDLGGIKQLGNGKIRIENFQKFAEQMNWEIGGEEYTTAFKAYNDALIELDKKTSSEITEELTSITSASAGDRVNITRLKAALDMSDDQISSYLMGLGATVENGIMTITETAKIPEIINRLAHQAAEAGAIIPEQMAELQDAVLGVLNSITKAIESGIKGSLSHVDLNNLQTWASSAGIGNLDFSETAEGVKLTTDAVNKLYLALKQINPQAASSLLDTIKDSSRQYDNFSSVLESIALAHENLNASLEIQNNLVGDTSGIVSRTQAYRNQLSVLNDVAQSMMATPDAFKFMDNKLPDEIQSVINIWENGSEAMASLKTASKKKYIGVQDWYNIIQTASGLMEAAGKEFSIKGKTAAQLMQEGLENIKVVGGKAQVDLSKQGMNFTSGIKDLKSNLTDGIRTLAKAEIEMLDAEIKVFEVLAAMEQLGDVDVNGNGIAFEIEDIFDVNRANGWTTSFEAYLKNLKNMADSSEELKEALQDFKFNGTSFYELLSASWDTWKKAGFTEETMSQFFAQLSTIDWSEDLGKLPEQLAALFSGLNLQVTIDTPNGFITFSFTGKMFNIDLSDEKVAAQVQSELAGALNKMSSLRGENLKETVRNAWNLYNDKDAWKSLSWDVKSSISIALGIASGNITTTQLDNGKWTSTYNGVTFSGNTRDAVLDKVAQAMEMEREGYTFKENSTGKVEGTKTIGSGTINVTMDPNGKMQFTANGEEANSYQEAVEKCVAKGQANMDMAGQTYKVTLDKGKDTERTATAIIEANAKLGIAYTLIKDGTNDRIIYNGIEFADRNKLFDYIKYAEPAFKKGGWETTTNGIYQITARGNAKVTYNTKTHTMEYQEDGITFKSGADWADYVLAKETALQNGEDHIVDAPEGGKEITFACMGYSAVLKVDAKGNMSYTVNVGDYGSVEATTIDELKTGIATIVKLNDLNGSVDSTEEGSQATLNINGKSILLKWNATGKVTAEAVQGSLAAEENAALVATAEEALKEAGPVTTSTDQPLNITASSVVITLADSSSVTLADSATQGNAQNGAVPPVPIPEVTLQPQAVKLDLSQVNAQTEDQQVTSAINVPVNLQVEPESAQESIDTFKKAIDETTGTMKVDADTEQAETKRKGMKETVDKTTGTMSIDADASLANAVRKGFKETVDNTDATINIQARTTEAINALQAVEEELAKVKSKEITITVKRTETPTTETVDTVTTASTIGAVVNSKKPPEATGNVGNAKAGGTLMGELGPELVVSGGRYFIVGKNGPEFVDLAEDAIVFNHLQTQQLLERGMSPTRGKAVTNERAATSFATGNTQGIAMASATATLAALKRLRAMWKSLESVTMSDLAGKAGGSGGGSSKDAATRKAWITEVERWYNLMQKIAQLEKDITHEEQLRTKLSSDINKNGKAYYESQKRSLQEIEQQMIAQETLNISRQEYFNQRRAALNSSLFSSLYTFDENGQLKYNDTSVINGQTGGFAFLSDLMTVDDFGKPKYSAEEQYNILTAAGFGDYMHYDSSGNEIVKEKEDSGKEKADQSTFYSNSVQAFWDVIDGQREEMQSLHDSIEDGENELNELANNRNEILQEIRDNQMEVENKVLKAIEDLRQAEIDALQDERDALEDAAEDFINGLQDQLDKEKQLYENNEDQKELTKLQRQLAILQRTGGSAASISSLQDQIASKTQDMYFDKQQEQIDAIQDASDKEIARLDAQISLMTETLEYERDNGLLWQQVYSIMEGTPETINEFIVANTEDYKAYSNLKWDEEYRKLDFQTAQWAAFRDDSNSLYNMGYVAPEDASSIADAVYGHSEVAWPVFNKAMLDLYGDRWKEVSAAYKDVFMTNYAQTGDISSATTAVTDAIAGMSGSLTSALNSGFAAANAAAAAKATESAAAETPSASSSSSSSGSGSGGSSGSSGRSGGSGGSNNNKKSTATTTTTTTEWAAYATFYKGSGASETLSATGTGSNAGEAQAAAYSALMKKKPPNAASMSTVRYEKRYKQGGLADFTGLAKMDGTKSKPEAVLNAHQTKILRDDILGNKPTSLMNLLLSLKDVYGDIGSNYSASGAGVVIENATVEMHVDKLANDYDAQRAGEQVMDKLLSIARKSVTTNVQRR